MAENHIEWYDEEGNSARTGVTNTLFGREEIVTGVDEITPDNLLLVLHKALATHSFNARQIEYLYRYMRGNQPILGRRKQIRPEICNKVVENHASEITQFTSSYFLGEPMAYIRRGATGEETSSEVSVLNEYMYYANKASHDKNMATWMAICGVAYRMVLPNKRAELAPDEAPYEIDTPDPRETFVVYHTGFGHRRVMGVRLVYQETAEGQADLLICGYTPKYYFEVKNDILLKWEPHTLGDVPIYEYRLNMARMGSFEPALPLLDAINAIMSNRVDGVEQFIQSFLKFKNCDIEQETVEEIRRLGAIVIKSSNGLDSDVDIVSQELNQQQVQTLVDYLYAQILVICGMPTTTKGGASTSDTGNAVYLRDGWAQCESRARDAELLFKQSEKEFLRLVFHIIRVTREFSLSLSEIDCKFAPRQHGNLQSKCQALQAMLEAGLHPQIAISSSGLFTDPMDVYEQSKEYLKKWDYIPMLIEENTENEDHEHE